jgi:hypothetical protein
MSEPTPAASTHERPRRSGAVVFFRAVIGPIVGGAVGAAVALLAGGVVMVAAGHGIAHAGEAVGLFLGAWAVAIVIGAAFGVGAFLVAATSVRLLRFALGRRPWPWSGSVHGGALAVGLLVALSSHACASRVHATSADSGGIYRLIIYVAAGVMAGPAMVVGGALGGWIHRRREGASAPQRPQ